MTKKENGYDYDGFILINDSFINITKKLKKVKVFSRILFLITFMSLFVEIMLLTVFSHLIVNIPSELHIFIFFICMGSALLAEYEDINHSTMSDDYDMFSLSDDILNNCFNNNNYKKWADRYPGTPVRILKFKIDYHKKKIYSIYLTDNNERIILIKDYYGTLDNFYYGLDFYNDLINVDEIKTIYKKERNSQ